MSYRAVMLGFVAGVALGASFSCGTQKLAPSCNTTTCTGCCKTDGTCVEAPFNAENATCGAPGTVCANCTLASQTCVDFVCGSMSGGGCNAANCAGCCTGTARDSVCITATSDNNCGQGGQVCTSCGAGTSCKAGVCAEPTAVGRACQSDSDCASLGETAQCRKNTSSGLDEYVGGYCTLDCSDGKQGSCPEGSACVEVSPEYGETPALCLDLCNGPSDRCREPGYACYPLTSGGARACWLAPLPQGPPADKVGQACSVDEQCQNPPLDGFCATGSDEDGGQGAFINGYCTAPCFNDQHCSVDGGAVCVGVTDDVAACFKRCDTPGQGQGSCRPGYVCQLVRDMAGNPLPNEGVCGPDCHNAVGLCGMKTCGANGYCQ
ncbi:MAG: hypothetical protein K1X64_03040 [Myxococcaceae bacterium]|nr:hypothetical protein [Myxococcaceae bacterium]